MGEIIAVSPKTNPIFAIFDPMTFPNEISEKPLSAACKLTISSGIEVANETTVRPMTIFDKFNLNESPTAERTKYSPPITKRVKPRSIKTMLIYLFFAKIHKLTPHKKGTTIKQCLFLIN